MKRASEGAKLANVKLNFDFDYAAANVVIAVIGAAGIAALCWSALHGTVAEQLWAWFALLALSVAAAQWLFAQLRRRKGD